MTSLSPLMPDWTPLPSALLPGGVAAQGPGAAGVDFAGLLDAAAVAPGLPGESAPALAAAPALPGATLSAGPALLNPLPVWGTMPRPAAALTEADVPLPSSGTAPEPLAPAQPITTAPAMPDALTGQGGSILPEQGTDLPPTLPSLARTASMQAGAAALSPAPAMRRTAPPQTPDPAEPAGLLPAIPAQTEEPQASEPQTGPYEVTPPVAPDSAAIILAAAPADPAVSEHAERSPDHDAAIANDPEPIAAAEGALAAPAPAPVAVAGPITAPIAVAPVSVTVQPPAAPPPPAVTTSASASARVIAAILPRARPAATPATAAAASPVQPETAASPAAPVAPKDPSAAVADSAANPAQPAPDPARTAVLAAAMPDADTATPAEAPVQPAAQAATQAAAQPSAPAPLGLPPAPPANPVPDRVAEARTAAPQLESTIAQVGDLREALRSARPAMTLQHAEFGTISLRLEPAAPDQWRAVLASRDPGFVPAMQAALDSRALAAAGEPSASFSGQTGTGQNGASQNGAGEQRYGASPNSGQGGSQPYLGHSGSRDGEAAPDHRRPSTAAALAARGQGEAEDPAGPARDTGGLFA